MSNHSERFDRNERRNSLAAFLRAIQFRKPPESTVHIDRAMAQLHPTARQASEAADDSGCIRSAN